MPISAQQQIGMEQKVGNHPKFKQDRKRPMLINIDDARLLPNIPHLRTHPKYRVYMGDINATLEERRRILATESDGNDVSDSGPFDVETAGRAELMAYAFTQFGEEIDVGGKMNLQTVRARVRALVKDSGSLA